MQTYFLTLTNLHILLYFTKKRPNLMYLRCLIAGENSRDLPGFFCLKIGSCKLVDKYQVC